MIYDIDTITAEFAGRVFCKFPLTYNIFVNMIYDDWTSGKDFTNLEMFYRYKKTYQNCYYIS
jgi:hypothetical protein|tara:strand:+ start:185 stop:370 length:186 start_codon:yes stop_codon:yes gene_type:complete